MQPLIEGGYTEPFLWALPYSALKRRVRARARLTVAQRQARIADQRMAVNAEADELKTYLESMSD